MLPSQPLFHEKTGFPKLILAIALLPLMIAFFSSSNKTEFTETILYPLIVSCLTSFILMIFKLEVAIYQNTISFRFIPFIKQKQIPTNEIVKASILKIRPLLDFGGWGIRYGRKGRAYTVRGNHVLAIELVNGNRIFLGISAIEDAQNALSKLNLPAFPIDAL